MTGQETATAEELIELLAESLKRRRHERSREEMPCIDIHALDGTVLTVTLREHHWGVE